MVDCLGLLWWVLCNKLCFVCIRPGMAMEIRFHQEEPMLDEWAAHGQSTCSVLGLLKTVPGLCKLDQKRPCVGCLKLMK